MPQYLRDELPLDPAPALSMHDKRIKAAFAMAPGIIKAFGMDQDQLSIPTYITVSARDTQAPPGDNAEFAAKHIPHAELSSLATWITRSSSMNATTRGATSSQRPASSAGRRPRLDR